MVVGVLRVDLRLPGAHSLKEKRRVVRGLVDRIRAHHAVAVGEVDDQDLWGNATLGIACVALSAGTAESVLRRVLDTIEGCPEVEVTSEDRYLESY